MKLLNLFKSHARTTFEPRKEEASKEQLAFCIPDATIILFTVVTISLCGGMRVSVASTTINKNLIEMDRTIKVSNHPSLKRVHIATTQSADDVYAAVLEFPDSLELLDSKGAIVKEVAYDMIYGTNTCHNIFYSPNGKFLAIETSGSNESNYKKDFITILEISTGKRIWQTNSFRGCGYPSPSGQYVVCLDPGTGSPNYPPAFLNSTGLINKSIFNLDFARSSNWFPNATTHLLAFPRDSSRVAVAIDAQTGFGNVALFSADGNIESRYSINVARVDNLEFSPDGKFLAVSAGDSTKHVLQLWNVSTNEKVWENPTPNSKYYLSFSDSGDRLAVAGELVNKICLFDSASGKTIFEFQDKEILNIRNQFVRIANQKIFVLESIIGDSVDTYRIISLNDRGDILGVASYDENEKSRVKKSHQVIISDGKIAVDTDDGLRVFKFNK